MKIWCVILLLGIKEKQLLWFKAQCYKYKA